MERMIQQPDESLAAWRARISTMSTAGWSSYRVQARAIVLDAIRLAMRSEDRMAEAAALLKRTERERE